ncbi:MAG: cytidine deaminase [Bacteroidia bacterium]|nr:cytidine deaminase [Bacteroidia bacterium]NNJ56066.1 cytidine deaminase [Bacteroidia bacterium]
MQIQVEIEELSYDALKDSTKQFLNQAIEAHHQSYAPYSQFHVGCSVKHNSGKTIMGSNQENASFPSGLCAERVALFESSKNLLNDKVTQIAIYARSTKYEVPKMLVPCAACLQVMSDIEVRQKEPIEIWMWDGSDAVFKANGVSQFLPFHFELNIKH